MTSNCINPCYLRPPRGRLNRFTGRDEVALRLGRQLACEKRKVKILMGLILFGFFLYVLLRGYLDPLWEKGALLVAPLVCD